MDSPGKCFAKRQHLRDTIYTLCSELNEDTEDEILSTTLTGSQLALDLLEDGPARKQPKYARSLTRLALRLLELPPDNYNSRLSELYNSELEKVYREELKNRLEKRNHALRLGAWASLIMLFDRNVYWAEELLNCYWPKKEIERIELFWIMINSGTGKQLISRLVDVIPRISPWKLSKHYSEVFNQSLYSIENISWLNTLEVLIKGHYNLGSDITLEFSKENSFTFTLPMISNFKSVILDSLEDIPNPCSDWSTLFSVLRFIENPCKKTLAHELKTIAKKLDQNMKELIVKIAPWPFGSCLNVFTTQSELLELINCI